MIARLFSVGLVAGMACLSVSAQQTLSDLVKDAKADWMFGQWEAVTDNGDTVRLNISWDLDKHVVVLHVKTSEMESKGYSALDQDAGTVKYISFDNRGSIGKGAWAMEAEELVLRIEVQNSERGPWKAGIVFTGNAQDGLRVRMHSIADSGDLAEPARTTFKFKKQAAAATKK